MITNLELFSKELREVNRWWVSGKIELKAGLVERAGLGRILQDLESKRITQVIGARRTGKTISLKQTIQKLLSKVEPRNILYYSLDDPSLYAASDNILKDMLDYFLENIAGKGRKYVFFDEIHAFPKWYAWLKSFFDRYSESNEIKFIISGSSSLSLQKEANLYLRGRSFEIEFFPFSFNEFLSACGLQVQTKSLEEVDSMKELEIRALESKISAFFKEYIAVGGFPEWFEIKNKEEWFSKLISDVPKKAIYEDIEKLYEIKNPKILENIFVYVVSNQSRILSYETINEMARLNRATLLNYLEYLKTSYLLLEIPKFAKSIKEQIKSLKKFLCIDQGLRNAILKDYEILPQNIGFIVENMVGVHLFSKGKLFYLRTNGEIDFILKKGNTLIPVESKYSEKPQPSKALINFMVKNKLKKAIIVNKNIFKKERIEGKQIYFLPLWLFLLLEF